MNEPTAHDRLGYLPWLDGLRAIAVAAVMLFHHWQFVPFDERKVTGGFLGVDVFFVVSGFLITALLLFEHRRSERIGVAAFWVRRSRRLLPALIVMLLGVAALAQWVFTEQEQAELRGDALSALFYVENWYHARHGITAVGHTWSLAIEEQWYLVWPLVVVGLTVGLRLRARLLGLFVGALAVMSFAWAASFADSKIDRVYHGTDTRAHALLVGALLGVVFVHARPKLGARARRGLDLIGCAGLFVLLAQFWLMSTQTNWLFRGGITVTAVATSAVIVAGVWGAGAIRAVLAIAPLRAIGIASYGLYLYHWPVFWWLRAGRLDLDGTRLLALRLVVTAAIATGSYWLIERPIRRGALIGVRFGAVIVPAVVVTAVLLVASTQVDLVEAGDVRAEFAAIASEHRDTRRVLIVGDASAAPLAAGLERESGVVATFSTPCDLMAGIPLVGGVRIPIDPACTAPLPRFTAARDGFDPEVVVVMIGATAGLDREVDSEVLRYDTPELAAHAYRRLDAIRESVDDGARRVVVLGAPCNLLPGEENAARAAWLRDVVAAWANDEEMALLDLADFQCPGGIPATTDDGPMFGSNGPVLGGLTPAGAAATLEWILDTTE